MGKKITYLTNYFHLFSRGADEICVMNTVHSLSKMGGDVTLVIPNFWGNVNRDNQARLLKYYSVNNIFSLKLINGISLYRFGFLGRSIYKSIALLKAILTKPDIFIVRQLETAVLLGILNFPVVLSYHHIFSLVNRRLFPVWRRMLNNPNKKVSMLCITENGRQELISKGIKGDRIGVASMGVQIEFYSTAEEGNKIREVLNLEQNKKIVCFSGNMYPGRGVELLIESAVQFPAINFVLIGGKREDQERCRNYAKKLQIKNLHFIDFINPAELPEYLQSADILIMPYSSATPTHQDMSPMKMFDYLATGKPIVATDFPVIREVLKDRYNAILVKPDSADELAKGIQWLIDNPEKGRKIGLVAKETAANFTWDKRAERMIDFLDLLT